MTLGLASKAAEVETDETVSDKLLAKQSLLLILVLTNHCTSDLEMHNPYRQALFSFTDSQGRCHSTTDSRMRRRCSGPIKCYITIFSANLTPTHHLVTLIRLDMRLHNANLS